MNENFITENKELIKKNSVEAYKMLNEATSETDLASYEQIIGRLTESKYKTSLSYLVCEVQPLQQNSGAIFVAKNNSGDIEIIKKTIELVKKTASTGMSQETYQDIKSMFPGNYGDTLIANMLLGVSDKEENTVLISKLASVATASTALTLSSPNNSEVVLFEVGKKVAELILQINALDYKTLEGYAILPRSIAAAYLSMGYFNVKELDAQDLYVGKHGKISYFINPDPSVTKVYVGVKTAELGKSSLIFTPYQYILQKATDADSGNDKMFMINRFAITENPLSVTDKMIYSFDVN